MQIERSKVGELNQKVTALLKRIDEGLQSIRHKLNYYNPDLKKWALLRIRERQDEFAAHDRLIVDLEKTGFTLRRRNDGSEKIIVPVKPTAIAVRPKPGSTKATGRNEFTCDAVLPRLHQAGRLDCSTQTGRCF